MKKLMMVGSSFGGGPFKMEASPCSTGDSATDPSYDIFTDDDYGL